MAGWVGLLSQAKIIQAFKLLIFLSKAHHVYLSHKGKIIGSQLNSKQIYTSKLLQLKRGWFDSLPDLQAFLVEFNNILRENTKEPDTRRDQPSFFMKIQPYDSPATYYSKLPCDKFTVVDHNAVDRLMKLIDNANFVMPERAQRDDIDGVSLIVDQGQMRTELFINADGDINAIIETRNQVPIEFQTRTSPALFKQLAEIIVYNKHKKGLEELANDTFGKNLDTVFDLRCNIKEKSKP